MGAAKSKIEDDKALSLCRERKRFVKRAIQERCSLAEAHVAYIHSLRDTGTALRKFAELEIPVQPSSHVTESAAHELLLLPDKPISQLSNSSSPFQHALKVKPNSPDRSFVSSEQFNVNHMKVASNISTVINEKLPASLQVTVHKSSKAERPIMEESDENSSLDTPSSQLGSRPWDYFDPLHPIDNEFSFDHGSDMNHEFSNADYISSLRKEPGISNLEEESEGDGFDSEDDFDRASNEPLVRAFQNRNADIEKQVSKSSINNTSPQIGEKNTMSSGVHEMDETTQMTPLREAQSVVPISNRKANGTVGEVKQGAMDLFSCMKEIEILFVKASEAGKELSNMLEANEAHFGPLFPKETAKESTKLGFLKAYLACCGNEAPHLDDAAPEKSEIKYLTWHNSVPSQYSPSRNLLSAGQNDDIDKLCSSLLNGSCMNSGSHASTLERLYAWERKLCDEVKQSVKIRKEYDLQCKFLRQQESRGESAFKIDKTRATVKDLYSRIRVAIQRIYSISQRIEELRDKELQPQLEELIEGSIKMWRTMLHCHERQYEIFSSACNISNTIVSTSSETQQQATALLELELNSLCSNFTKWISAHKSYVSTINGWLLKCIIPMRRQKSSRRKQQPTFSPHKDIAPPIFVTCKDWLDLLNDLPTTEVADSIKDLVALLSRLLPRQDKRRESSKTSFGMLSKEGKTDERKGNFHTAESYMNSFINYDSLYSCLAVFLDRLKTFAESAVVKYEGLKTSVYDARTAYEGSI